MIDPSIGGAVEGDSITAPNVLRVQVSDLEVLKDHVVGTSGDSEAFAQDNTVSANTENGLIARHHEGVLGRFIVGHLGFRCSFGAPVVRVDGKLTRRRSPVGSTSGLRGFAFSASEVERLGDDDVQRTLLAKVVGQLGVGLGRDCWSRPTTSGL